MSTVNIKHKYFCNIYTNFRKTDQASSLFEVISKVVNIETVPGVQVGAGQPRHLVVIDSC